MSVPNRSASRRPVRRPLPAAMLTIALLGLVLMSSFKGVKAAAAPKAYVGLFKDNAVAVIDTATNSVLKTIPVPVGPHGLVITPDGHSVYVSSDGDSKVSVI